MRIRTISFEDHYVKMDREFAYRPWAKFIFIINALCTIGCFIAYIIVDGKELFLALYIPLDVALNLAKTLFYYYYLF